MTDGITEAMREDDDGADVAVNLQRFAVVVLRRDATKLMFVVESTTANGATWLALRRGALSGLEVESITITKEQR